MKKEISGKKETSVSLMYRILMLFSVIIISQLQGIGSTQRAGYTINYYDTFKMNYQYNMIFNGKEYHFKADNDSPVILDCGSNIGLSILYFKQLYPKAKIIGFEPCVSTFGALKQNIEQNNLTDVTVHKHALTDKKELITIYSDHQGSGVTSIFKERSAQWPNQGREMLVEEVEGAVLSEFINQEIDMLKMDIEGAELKVFQEIAAQGKLRLVKNIVMEYHHHIKSDVDEFSQLLKILEENGFGYHIKTDYKFSNTDRGKFQDIVISAYQKKQS